MIVSLKKSIPVVIGSLPEAKITSKWLKCEINKYILGLAEVGFKVRAANDDHPSNVNAFTRLHEIFDGDNKTFIKHPAYADFARKTYLSSNVSTDTTVIVKDLTMTVVSVETLEELK